MSIQNPKVMLFAVDHSYCKYEQKTSFQAKWFASSTEFKIRHIYVPEVYTNETLSLLNRALIITIAKNVY